VIGTFGAWAKIAGGRLARSGADLYTTVLRGIPDLLVIYLFYFGGSSLLSSVGRLFGETGFISLPGFAAGAMAIGVVSGAHHTEVFRGAFRAVNRGELEAARAVGMGRALRFRRIIAPLVMRYALPGLGNVWQLVLKESALVSVTGVVELYPAGADRLRLDGAAILFLHDRRCALPRRDHDVRLDAAPRRASLSKRDDESLIDVAFMSEAFGQLLAGVPLTLQLALLATALGAVIALGLAAMRVSGIAALDAAARLYVFVFRGSPLLVQIFLIYYGLGQFPAVRQSILWPFLRQPYWCAVLALTLNTAAYASEIIRGGLISVPHGEIEAARACGMSRSIAFRRIVLPLALRQALPAYGNELIIMIKATSLASIITLMEITGIAAKLVSETYRVIEVFVVAGALYLAINFVLTRIVMAIEYRLTPHLRPSPAPIPMAFGQGGAG